MVDARNKQENIIFRFFKFILRAVRNYLIFSGAMVTIVPLLFVYLASEHGHHLPGKEPAVLKGSNVVLQLELSGNLTLTEPSFQDVILANFFSDQESLDLPELRNTLQTAAKDDRIKSLEIKLTDLRGDAPEMTELRRILLDFSASGKPIYLHTLAVDDANISVVSTANEISLAPAGGVMLTGPVFNLVYFGPAAQKLGIDFEVVRHGKYKSAFEPLVNSEPSSEVLTMYRDMADASREYLIKMIADSRHKDASVIRTWLQKSLYSPKDAVQAGIVDHLKSYSEFSDHVKTTAGNEATAVTASDYQEVIASEKMWPISNHAAGIALIHANGEIALEASEQGSDITPDALKEELHWAGDEADVKAVVMRIDSPGGSALASDIIWEDVKRLAAKKPVIVSMGRVAASGGYYISSPARYIFAEANTFTGSIGVIGLMPKFGQFAEKYGVSFHTIAGTSRLSLIDPGKKLSDDDKTILSGVIDETYDLFLQRVAEGRKMEKSKVDMLGQGRVYTGLQAQANGLVDGIGGLFQAFDKAKELAGLDTKEKYPILRYEGKARHWSMCTRSLSDLRRCMRGIGSSLKIENQTGVEQGLSVLRKLVSPQSTLQSRTLAWWPQYYGTNSSDRGTEISRALINR
jgi:protease IV